MYAKTLPHMQPKGSVVDANDPHLAPFSRLVTIYTDLFAVETDTWSLSPLSHPHVPLHLKESF